MLSPIQAQRRPFAILATAVLSLWVFGCGSMEETTDEQWNEPPAISETARLEYRIDSLSNENRMMRQQLEALAAENRGLTARSAELETKLAEAEAKLTTQPPVSSRTPVTRGETPSPFTGSGSEGYDAALATYRSRDFSGAAAQFEGLLAGGISDDLADNCHYWIGESYFGQRKFSEAIEHFTRVFDYKTSEKKADAQFMIGNSYMAMGDRARAREEFNKVVTGYPTSPLVRRAQERVARLQ